MQTNYHVVTGESAAALASAVNSYLDAHSGFQTCGGVCVHRGAGGSLLYTQAIVRIDRAATGRETLAAMQELAPGLERLLDAFLHRPARVPVPPFDHPESEGAQRIVDAMLHRPGSQCVGDDC